MKNTLLILLILILTFPYSGNAQNHSNAEKSKINRDSSKVEYELNCAISLGGESKFALFFPKVNFLRKHRFNKTKLYYGAGLGVHGGFVSVYGSLSAMAGIERRFLDLETSISHFRTSRINVDDNDVRGPFSQNLFNLKLGVIIKNVKLRIVRSFVINEGIPTGQEKIPLLDIGKINGNIWGIELQFIVNLKEKSNRDEIRN